MEGGRSAHERAVRGDMGAYLAEKVVALDDGPVGREADHVAGEVGEREQNRCGLLDPGDPHERPLAVVLLDGLATLDALSHHAVHALVAAVVLPAPPQHPQRPADLPRANPVVKLVNAATGRGSEALGRPRPKRGARGTRSPTPSSWPSSRSPSRVLQPLLVPVLRPSPPNVVRLPYNGSAVPAVPSSSSATHAATQLR